MNWLSILGLEVLVARWRANVIEAAIAAEDRMDLVRLEWQEQKKRLEQILVLTIAVAGLTVVALIMASLAVLVQFWDTPQRTMVAWIVAGVWVAGWAATLLSLVSVAQRARNGFALTRKELAQDWSDIKERL
ncbi:MAG: phage holin family protein [Acidovorax sp.]|nr:MAG: phage holin family protein [Acidovorax sp.]